MSTAIRPAPADVVVVGAGLSGLICARELRRRGLRVLLLEARERIGGRLHGRRSAGGVAVDLGGQWVGASHRRLQALLAEHGLRCFPTPYEGRGVLLWNGVAHSAAIEHDFGASLLFLKPGELTLPAAELEATLALQRRFQQLVQRVPAAAPWQAEGADALDRLTVAHWLERQGAGDLARYPFEWLTRMGGSGGFEPQESSILHLAWTQAVAPQQETPEAWLVEGGIARLAGLLAADLGEALRLGTPVHAIDQNGGGVRLGLADGETIAAAMAVVAIPPPLRLGIRFTPELPPRTLALLQRSPMGAMVKVLALYPRPFWRERGLSGLGIGNLPTLELTVDSSPPDGPGILAGFIAGERVWRWQALGEPERRRAVLADLRAWWGDAAAEPSELVLHDWTAESWSGGAFTSFLTPGTWTGVGAVWQQPHGRVVWAGTEVASRWPGYFEGAIEAGLAAAAQVTRQLGGAAAGEGGDPSA